MWTSLLTLLSATASVPQDCHPLPGWEAIANEAQGKYLIFGETHGSSESPEAVAEYVCAVADSGPVLVALEFSSETDPAWQRAWAAPHEEFRETLLDEVSDWGERRDGVASAAMLAMVERLHALKTAGRDIDIVAFNGARSDAQRAAFAPLPGQEPHEAAQAANIRAASLQRRYAHVVVLAGNLHATKMPLTVRETSVRPMAMLLAEPGRVVSLDMHGEGGTTWSCQLVTEPKPGEPVTDDMVECRDFPIGASRPARTRGFHLDPAMAEWGFDGVFALGPVSASPPPAID